MKALLIKTLFFEMIMGLCSTIICTGGDGGDCRLPSDFGVSADIPEVTIGEPLRGFEEIFACELDRSTVERFGLIRHYDMFSYDRDLPEFASREIRSVIWDTVTQSLKEYFVMDPDTNLPFVYKTIGALVEDNGLSLHSIDFGIRRIVEGDPYAFVGHSVVVDDEEILELEIRACFRGWRYIVPELVLTAPVSSTWTMGAGVRYEVEGSPSLEVLNIEDSCYYNGSLKGGTSFFLGFKGSFLGGHLYLGTGYPEPFSVLFGRSL